MNGNLYNIDFIRLARQQTPVPLRKIIWLNFIAVLLYPAAQLHQGILQYRKAKLYELKITPQVCYLELLLNDKYDFTLRRIYITDGLSKLPTFIYMQAELKPVFISKRSENKPRIIYTSGESGNQQDDFIVFVPYAILFEESEMISLVKKFKLAGTKFKIQRF